MLDYNGKFDGKEYNFTIGFTSDIAIPPALVSEKDKCYKWNVRGKKNFTACYKSLNP